MRWTAMVLLLASCGSGSDGTGDGGNGGNDDGNPLTGDELAEVCTDFCAHATKCGWETNEADCMDDCSAGAAIFRGSVWREWIECNGAAACAEPPGKGCYLEALADLEPRPVHDDYVARCEQARSDCGIDGVLPDCDPSEVSAFSDPYVRDEVLPCFDLACDAMVACIEKTVRDSF